MERRTCKRKIKRLNITFSDGSLEHRGISSDFSCSGLFIRTRKGFESGTVVHMILDLNGGIPLTGFVIRLVKPITANIKCGVGIEITVSHPGYDNLIRELYGNR